MKTKDKILAVALQLFNRDGIREVTMRKIALELGMSHGNLNYHFKTKGELISTLYFQLVAQMDQEMKQVTVQQPILSLMYKSSLLQMSILYEYRFILRDFYKVLEADEQLKTHYVQLQEVRKQQYLLLFNNLVLEGLIRKEELENEYERLYQRMNILGDNWVNASELFYSERSNVVVYYHQLLFELIYPYLTEKGKREYREAGLGSKTD